MLLDFLGQPHVIVIKERDPTALGHAQGMVPRRRCSAVRLEKWTDAIAVRKKLRACIVLRAVVDDDDFANGNGLRQNAVDRFPDLPGAIVSCDHHGNINHGLINPLN